MSVVPIIRVKPTDTTSSPPRLATTTNVVTVTIPFFEVSLPTSRLASVGAMAHVRTRSAFFAIAVAPLIMAPSPPHSNDALDKIRTKTERHELLLQKSNI